MKILIADDEQLARWRLSSLLEEINPEDPIVAEAENGLETLRLAHQYHPDIILLDISMPGMNGIDVAQELTKLYPQPTVIFTTAFDEYALDAFEANAIDYLVKPIRKQRLELALDKAKIFANAQMKAIGDGSQQNTSQRIRIKARFRGELTLIDVDEIRYFRSEQKYTVVRTADSEILIEEPLTALEKEFEDRFVRIHRNALVALEYIEGLEKKPNAQSLLKLRDVDEGLEVSRRHIPKVRNRLKRLVLN